MPNKIDPATVVWDDEKISPDTIVWDDQATDQPLSWSDVPGQMLQNAPDSALEYGKALVTPFQHPIQTLDAVGNTVAGGVSKLIPGEQPKEPYWDAFMKFVKDRYGSMDAVKNTLAKDPVGVLGDASAVLMGLGPAGAATRVPSVANAGARASRVGAAIEPLSIAGGMAKGGAAVGKGLGAGMLGFTTGAGSSAVKHAVKTGMMGGAAGREFRAAMRGNISKADLVEKARTGLGKMAELRRDEYLREIQVMRKDTQAIDASPIYGKMEELLKKDFNVDLYVDEMGNYQVGELAYSTLMPDSYTDIQNVVEIMNQWKVHPEGFTLSTLDNLKRKLDSFYSENKNSRAFVTALKKEVKNTITKNYPEYGIITERYAKLSNDIDEIERTLSVGKRSTTDTALRKLMTVMKDNYEFRQTLVEKMDALVPAELKAQIAGQSFSGYTPLAFMGKTLETGAILGFAYRAMQMGAFMGSLALASPRVVGELAHFLGRELKYYQKVKEYFPTAQQRAMGYQAGRLNENLNRDKDIIPALGQ